MKITFVLNRPRNPRNIGAAARGMANFGFRNMTVVNPYIQAWQETRSAVHAAPVVRRAQKFTSIKAAIKSAHFVIGTSAGTRRKMGAQWISLEQLPPLISQWSKKNSHVAILFGSEKTGLTNEDLGYCHIIVRIPTVPEVPSMNLAQAVAVVAFALREIGSHAPGPTPKVKVNPTAIDVEKLERLITQGLAAFTKPGLLKGWTAERSEQRLRKAFYNWNLSAVDIAMLHSLFRWVLKRCDLRGRK